MIVLTYHKQAYRAESAANVEWDTLDPLGTYPGGGTLTPPLGIVLYTVTSESLKQGTVDSVANLRLITGTQLDSVQLRYHTADGDKGGGIFDRKPVGSYVDDNGTIFVAGSNAWVRRGEFEVTPYLWGGRGDLSFSLTGNYINPASITGGTLDNAAIISAAAYANTHKKPLYIPAGVWLFNTTQLHFTRGLEVRGDKGRTVIVSRINKPFVIGTITDFCFEVKISGIDLLCYEDHTSSSDWVAVDLYATTMSNISFAARGWDYNLRSVHENVNPALDIRGENYQSHFEFLQMSYGNGLPFPQPTGTICHIEGQINGSVFRCETANPQVASLILRGGLRGNLGSTITIDYVLSDTCDNAIIIADGGGINIRHVYAEGCLNAIAATNCRLLDMTNIRGGDVIVTDCQGVGYGESVARLVNVRSQVVNRGAAFGQAPKAVSSTNVGVLSMGHNFEVGLNQRHPTCHHSQLDGRNLFGNGSFDRWIGNVPWLWRTTPGYSPVFTKCGTGLGNTTKSAAVPYCCHVVGVTSGEFYITPPLGDQYLGTTISISLKVKLEAGYAGLCIKGNNPASFDSTSGSRAVNEAGAAWIECPDEAGGSNWRLITFSWVIDQGICDNGIALQMATNSACDIYLSEMQANFGVAVPRGYVHPREVLGGVVGVKRGGVIEIESATLPSITTDPIISQALVSGDRAVDTTGLTGGWRYNGAVWEPVRDSEASILKARLIAASNGKLVRAVIGEDLPDSGTINSWPAFVGAACPAASTGRATLGTLRGRKAAVFSASADAQAYTFEGSMPEYWCVSMWNDTLPFPYFNSMIGGQTTAGVGQRLIGSSTNSNLQGLVGTIEKNGAASAAVDAGVSTIWRVYGAAGSDGRQIGCGDSGATLNWHGPIACALAFSTVLTAEEAAVVWAVLKAYYSI